MCRAFRLTFYCATIIVEEDVLMESDMAVPIFEAKFVGLHIRIIERKGNPCSNPALQQHYRFGYKLALITTTRDNPSIHSGHYSVKLVRVQPSWNPDIQKEHDPKAVVVIVRDDEIIADIDYFITRYNGMDADKIIFTFRSTVDFLNRQSPIYINHNVGDSLSVPFLLG